MIAYWMMFLFPAVLALAQPRPSYIPRRSTWPLWGAFLLLFTLLIGYRYDVGADWGSYIAYVRLAGRLSLEESLVLSDPGYMAINWLSAELGWGIFGVNLICGAIFIIGLISFCRKQPYPILALAVAVPYLTIVVAMGYSRQGVAIGLGMLALAALGDQKTRWFLFYAALAVLFHKTAIILVPIALVANTRNRLFVILWTLALVVIFYYLFVVQHIDRFVQIYIEAEYESQGALIRISMNAVPAAVFLALRSRFPLRKGEKQFWTYIALGSLFMVPLLFIVPSTTAVDRIALYFIPLQIFVFSRLPITLGGINGSSVIVVGVIAYYTAVLFVWLNFASHAHAWLPYRFYPFSPHAYM